MKNKGVLIVIGILIIAIVSVVIVFNYPKENVGNLNNSSNGRDDGNIGGQTDTYGCLAGAGYSWNESVFACVREWELNSEERRAVNIAIAPLSYYVTVTEVSKQECEGCYNIKLQRNDNRQIIEVNLKNWTVGINGISEEKKNYCTEKQRGAEICTMEYMPVCGWFDESIKCIKYPCAQTYSNACAACSPAKVAYWTAGECPK